MGDVTVVTALYDIGRETRGDGRSFAQYLSWFKITLSLEHTEFVKRHRRADQTTKIIEQEFNQAPCYGYLAEMRSILCAAIYQHSFQNTRWSFTPSLGGLRKPFATTHSIAKCLYGWTPAAVWPHSSWVAKLSCSSRVWIQADHMFQYLPMSTSFIGWSIPAVNASVFAANKSTMSKLCRLMRSFLKKDMLERKRLDNEQVALGILANRHKKLFRFVTRKPRRFSQRFSIDYNSPALTTFMATDIHTSAFSLSPPLSRKPK